ncbi:MAG: hypothetical protein IH889_10800, partial [Planctomycetes bacterium]|nr:hypothetical protein [Planctomycetota bacterium]
MKRRIFWHVVGAVGMAMTNGAAIGQYVDGDLYLISTSLEEPSPPPSGLAGIMRIDPVTANHAIVATCIRGMRGHGSYDPFRDRIIASVFLGNPYLVASDGTCDEWLLNWSATPVLFAPVGDGRVYFFGGAKMIGWVDGAGVVQDLLDATGTMPFAISSVTGDGGLIYDIGTNALFFADGGDADLLTRVRRIPLSPDGTQVAGPVDVVSIDLSPGSFEHPKGISRGPDGLILIAVDDNTNSTLPRLLTVDPATLAISTYATCGYFGVAGQIAGVYSRVRDEAVVLDTLGNNLRLFRQGASGEGTIWVSTGVSSPVGSGETATLIEIGGTINLPPSPADLNGDGCADSKDLKILLGAWCSAVNDPNPPSPPCENCTQANLD